MPSKWEGLPIALLEALALEIPIVISNCSSSLGLVMTSKNETCELSFLNGKFGTDCGWIVNCLNESAETIEIWQDCLEKVVLESYPLNNRDSGRLAIAKRFDVREVRKVWQSLISEIN
jgi:glycosyltransferase involved in cell wall biosynthesis